MTFVEAFYSFNLELVDVERNVYQSVRVKTPKHPYESMEHLYARLLAFVHHYEPGQSFSRGLFEESDPTVWRKDLVDNVVLWLQVGVPDKKKIQKALNQYGDCEFRVYFWEPDQPEQFCHHLRGTRGEWLDRIAFYQIQPDVLAQLVPNTVSSAKWQVTVLDDTLYLVVNGAEYETRIDKLDMPSIWRAFLETELAERRR